MLGSVRDGNKKEGGKGVVGFVNPTSPIHRTSARMCQAYGYCVHGIVLLPAAPPKSKLFFLHLNPEINLGADCHAEVFT